jgi:hypothetical protein
MGPLLQNLERAKYTLRRGLSTQVNVHLVATETITALHTVPRLEQTVAATLAAETITDLFDSFIRMYDSVLSVRANLKEQLRICDVFLVDAVNYLELAEDAANRWTTVAATTSRPMGAANVVGDSGGSTTNSPVVATQVRPHNHPLGWCLTVRCYTHRTSQPSAYLCPTANAVGGADGSPSNNPPTHVAQVRLTGTRSCQRSLIHSSTLHQP